MFKKDLRWPWIASAAGILVVAILLVGLFPYLRNYNLAAHTKLSLSPDLASPGTTIIVSGWGYAANEKVVVYFQNRSNGIIQTKTTAGGFFNVALTLPKKYADGLSYVYAINDDGTVTKAAFKFVKPTLTFTSVRASLHGTGFIANEPISFSLRDGNTIVKIGKGKTDDQGHFTVKLALPALPFSRRTTLTVTDSSQQKKVSLAVHLTPQINLNSVAGPIGATVTITGKGFGRKETVSIALQGKAVRSIVSDKNGRFSTKFVVPSSAKTTPYYDNVRVTGRHSKATAFDSFQVLPSAIPNTTTVTPGQQIIVKGSQFTPRQQIQITLFNPKQGASTVGVPLKQTPISAKGDFTVHFTIPHDIKGKRVYIVLLVDEASGLSVPMYFKIR